MHAPSSDFTREPVAGSGQYPGALCSSLVVILNAVDEWLGVLDSDPNGEAFSLHQDILFSQQPVDVTGTMTCSENHRIPGELLVICAGSTTHFFAVLGIKKPFHLRPEVNLTARLKNACAHRLDHIGQQV